jgi:hypothetical protein
MAPTTTGAMNELAIAKVAGALNAKRIGPVTAAASRQTAATMSTNRVLDSATLTFM